MTELRKRKKRYNKKQRIATICAGAIVSICIFLAGALIYAVNNSKSKEAASIATDEI